MTFWSRKKSQNESEDDNLTPWEKYQRDHQNQNAHHKTKHHSKTTLTNKLPQLKKRVVHRIKINLIIIVSMLALASLFLIYLITPLSRVNEINVTGEQTVAIQKVINASGITHSTNVINVLVRRKQIAKQITTELPRIKTAVVDMNGINNLNIRITEYPLAGFQTTKNGYYAILMNGKVIHQLINKPIGNYPLFDNFNSGKYLSMMIAAYEKIPNKIRNSISEIKYQSQKDNPYQIVIFMNDGNEIIGDMRTISNKIIYYPEIAAQLKEKSVIDLEVGAYSYPLSDIKEESSINSKHSSTNKHNKSTSKTESASSSKNDDSLNN